MAKKKICFVAQFPPPMHGLSKAVDTLYNSELKHEFEFEKIDITSNKKILSNLIAIKKSKADLFYFTISQTRVGNVRDLIILKAVGNRPCLVHLHGGYYRTMFDSLPILQKHANIHALNKLAGGIVLGPSLKWIFDGIIRDNCIYTVPNCVDDKYLMSEDEFISKINGIENKTVKHILYLSNFISSKGYPKMLEMARLEKKRVDEGGIKKFHFDFAGKFFETKEETFFWNYVKENDLTEYITYHGVVGGEKKRSLLLESDVFCLLTTYPNEGQPISILEAMGNGMVIVSTDHAGINDQVKDGISGIVVNKNSIDIKNIYNKLLNLTDYKDIMVRNRDSVNSTFSQANYIDNMRACFKRCL